MGSAPNWSPAEKELYALGTRILLDDMERQRRQWAESWAPDSTSMDEAMREHAARMAQLEADQRAWFARFIDGDEATEAGPSTTDVAAARIGAMLLRRWRPPPAAPLGTTGRSNPLTRPS